MSAAGIPETHPFKTSSPDDSSSGEVSNEYQEFLRQSQTSHKPHTFLPNLSAAYQLFTFVQRQGIKAWRRTPASQQPYSDSDTVTSDSSSALSIQTDPPARRSINPSVYSHAPRKLRKAYPYEHSSREGSAAICSEINLHTMPATRKTRSTTSRPSILSRLRGRKPRTTTTTTTTTRTTKTTSGHGAGATTHHHKRKPSLKDKVSGAMLKLKGTVTRRPGEKAAGTRRMRGTDGKGSHNRRRW